MDKKIEQPLGSSEFSNSPRDTESSESSSDRKVDINKEVLLSQGLSETALRDTTQKEASQGKTSSDSHLQTGGGRYSELPEDIKGIEEVPIFQALGEAKLIGKNNKDAGPAHDMVKDLGLGD